MKAKSYANNEDSILYLRVKYLKKMFLFFEIAAILLLILQLPFDFDLVNAVHFGVILYLVFIRYQLKKERVDFAISLFIIGITLVATWLMWTAAGIFDEAILIFPTLMIFCGLLGFKKLFIFQSCYLALTIGLIGLGNSLNWFSHTSPESSINTALIALLLLSLMGAVVWVLTSGMNKLLSKLDKENKLLALSESRIQNLLNLDQLTGLPNKRYALEHFTHQVAILSERSKMVVMFLDLDSFKSINDSFGHNTGDYVLKTMAARIQQAVQPYGIVCRQGGDEFLIILSINAEKPIDDIAKNIQTNINQAFEINQTEVKATASIGIAIDHEKRFDLNELLRNADIALYVAKDEGRNTWSYFKEEMLSDFERNATLLFDLRQAISLDQMTLHYQPKHDLTSNKILGAESLLRWNHPTKGMIYPNDFIKIAESTEAIVEIGEWVIDQACKACSYWIKQGLDDINVAVNVSPIQFKRSDLVGLIKTALRKHNLSADNLIVEITESTLIDDSDSFKATLLGLDKLGIKLSIDDFGKGYSNLAYLKKISMTSVKIDRLFISNMLRNQQDLAIVKTIIGMCQILKVTSVAEGVECEETIDALNEMGCSTGQGFYWSKALPLEEFITYSHNNCSIQEIDKTRKTSAM